MAREYHLHLISDSTGETLNTVAKAVCAQFDGVTVREHIYSLVRNKVQLRRAVDDENCAVCAAWVGWLRRGPVRVDALGVFR